MHVVSWCDWSPSLPQSRRLGHPRADAGALQSMCATERLVTMSRVTSLYPDNLYTTGFSALDITINVHARSLPTSLSAIRWACECAGKYGCALLSCTDTYEHLLIDGFIDGLPLRQVSTQKEIKPTHRKTKEGRKTFDATCYYH